jgi:cytochrome c-type biogenesis protein CcmH
VKPDAGAPLSRRSFLAATGAIASTLVARDLLAQQQPSQNFTPMEQGAYRPTLRAAKPGATPQLTVEERDALEHRLKCQCGCILDIYTCRTTDFTCQVSPAMHRDVLRLIEGGYDADEILAAFVETYGEVALTAPVKEGFNWAGYLAPGVGMMIAALGLTVMIRRWTATAQRNAALASAEVGATSRAATEGAMLGAARDGSRSAPIPGVSAEEMDRLDRALREDT